MSHTGEPLITVLLLVFFSMILPAIIIWMDEYLFVDEVEKEERERGKLTPSH